MSLPRLRFGRGAACLVACLAVLATTLATAQVTDAPRGDTRIVVFGDFNGPYGSTTYPAPVAGVVNAILGTWRPDLVVFTGDVVAGQSRSLSAADLAAMWLAFDREVASQLRSAGIPYALTVGNHDASSLKSAGAYAFAADRAAAQEYWSRPEHTAGLELHDSQDLPFHYSFTLGDVFVAVIDASSAAVPAEWRSWLAGQLDSEAAQAATARFVVGHLPLVPVSMGRDAPGEYVADAAGLADVLRAGCATAYVSGHHAAYYPGTWDGLELLAAGGVGARRLLGDAGPARSTVTLVDVWHEPPRIAYTTYDAGSLEPVLADALPTSLPSGLVLSRRASAPRPIDCGGG